MCSRVLSVGFRENPDPVYRVECIDQHAVHEQVRPRAIFRACVDSGWVWRRCGVLRLKVVDYDFRWRKLGLARYRKALSTRSGQFQWRRGSVKAHVGIGDQQRRLWQWLAHIGIGRELTRDGLVVYRGGFGGVVTSAR